MKPKGSQAGVVALDLHRLSDSNKDSLLVAREDTVVEVYSNMGKAAVPVFELHGSIKVGDSITNMSGVFFGEMTPEGAEILITTYSGRILGIRNDVIKEGDIEVVNKGSSELKEIENLNLEI